MPHQMTPFIRSALDILTTALGEDFHAYTASVATRIVAGRLMELGVTDHEEYLLRLRSLTNEQRLLARLLRVRHSSFFRNPLQWELFTALVLPSLAAANLHLATRPFRAWCSACAGGEEAYSLAITLGEAAVAHQRSIPYQLFATDVAEDGLNEARRGIYPVTRLHEVSLRRLYNCFIGENELYKVCDAVRNTVSFSRYDMLDALTYVPPECVFGNFDLILCRNFVMYLDPYASALVFDKLHKSLAPHGVLMLGTTETPPVRYAGYWERLFPFGCLYRKAASGSARTPGGCDEPV